MSRRRGVAVRGDRFAPSAAAAGIGNAISVDAINQVLHAVWASAERPEELDELE